MTTTSGAGVRRFARDPDDDVDTCVFARPQLDGAWDRLMVLQIMRELEPRVRSRPAPRVVIRGLPSDEPNVFLTPALATDPPPPWAVQPLEETSSKRVRVIRRRSILPWVTFAMTFSLGFGVLNDPVVRRETGSQLQSSAIRLYRFVSRIRT